MRPAVGDIVKLIGPYRPIRFRFRHLQSQALGIAHVVVRVLVRHRRHFHQSRAGQLDRVFLFLTLGVGNDDNRLESHRRRDHRQANPGVARRSLDDHATGAQRARTHRITDDEQGCAVFYRLAGVQKFRLAVNHAAGHL